MFHLRGTSELQTETAEQSATKPNAFIVGLTLIFLMALSAVLSYGFFLRTSLQLDESQSLYQTSHNLPSMYKLVGEDVHVPLYHTLLHFWLKIFGNSIVSARSMSLVFFVLCIPAIYLFAVEAFKNRKLGIFAAILMTVSPFANWYSGVARMYTLLAFITIVHQIYFLRVFRRSRGADWIGYFITALLGIYTHYFFWFVLATEGLFYLIRRREFAGRKVLLKFSIIALTLVAAIAPWLYYVKHLGIAGDQAPHLAAPSSIDVFNAYSQFIFGFQTNSINTIIVSFWPIIVLLAFFALQRRRHITSEATFFVLNFIIPIVGAYALSVFVQPIFLSRYLIVTVPTLFIFIGWILMAYPKTLMRTVQALLIVSMIAALGIEIVNPRTPVKENYAEATAYVAKSATPQDVIIASSPFTIYPLQYYYHGNTDMTTLPHWDRFNSGAIPVLTKANIDQEVTAANGSYQRAFLILSYDQGYQSDIQKYYDSHYQRLANKTFSNNLTVREYKLRYDKPLAVTIP